MKTKHVMEDTILLSIADAVEMLTRIADFNFEEGFYVTRHHERTICGKILHYRTVHALSKSDSASTIEVLKETFRVILKYLQSLYKEKRASSLNDEEIEGIKGLILLTLDAAKKLDAHLKIFKDEKLGSIKELKEFLRIKEFYQKNIKHEVDEKLLGSWVLGLSSMLPLSKEHQTDKKTTRETSHVFIEFESLKKDYDYELFFLRKEDGSRFFNPRLLRNMKLVCDFESYIGTRPKNTPPIVLKDIKEQSARNRASYLLSSLRTSLGSFYRESLKEKGELIHLLQQAFIALRLATLSRRRDDDDKRAQDYYLDYQRFLRDAINSMEYRKLLAYPPGDQDPFMQLTLSLIDMIVLFEYESPNRFFEIDQTLFSLLQENRKKQGQNLVASLKSDDKALKKALQKCEGGSLSLLLENLEKGSFNAFDPIMQENFPCVLFETKQENQSVKVLFTPSPIIQRYINEAEICPEFRAFLRALKQKAPAGKLLYINFQDATSWQEHFRVKALESLSHFEKGDSFSLVSLPKDTEFYHQLAPFDEINDSKEFLSSFLHEMVVEDKGFFFDANVSLIATCDILETLLHTVHKHFFQEKKSLSKEERLDFIEITYAALELYITKKFSPDYLIMTCKDGIDIGSLANALFFVLEKLDKGEELNALDQEKLASNLFGPAFLVRGRGVHEERLDRFFSALKRVLSKKMPNGGLFGAL